MCSTESRGDSCGFCAGMASIFDRGLFREFARRPLMHGCFAADLVRGLTSGVSIDSVDITSHVRVAMEASRGVSRTNSDDRVAEIKWDTGGTLPLNSLLLLTISLGAGISGFPLIYRQLRVEVCCDL